MAKETKTEKKAATKEIAKKESTEVALTSQKPAWGTENIDKNDLIIPKIVIGQGLSKAVTEGDIGIGDIYESLERKILAKGGKTPESIQFIPFGMFKTWLIFEKPVNSVKNAEYVKTEQYTSENANYKWEEVIGGMVIQRHLVQNYFVILPSDVEKGEKEVFPFVLPFKRTGMQAGKFISTVISKQVKKGSPSAVADHVFEMSRKLEDGKKGTYFKPEMKVARKTSDLELAIAFDWYKTLETTEFIVDDSDERDESAAAEFKPKADATVQDNSEY